VGFLGVGLCMWAIVGVGKFGSCGSVCVCVGDVIKFFKSFQI